MSEQCPDQPFPREGELTIGTPAESEVIEIEVIPGVYEVYDAKTGEVIDASYSEE